MTITAATARLGDSNDVFARPTRSFMSTALGRRHYAASLADFSLATQQGAFPEEEREQLWLKVEPGQ